jgi:hypothetical protein
MTLRAEHLEALESLDYKPEESAFLHLVAIHSGLLHAWAVLDFCGDEGRLRFPRERPIGLPRGHVRPCRKRGSPSAAVHLRNSSHVLPHQTCPSKL